MNFEIVGEMTEVEAIAVDAETGLAGRPIERSTAWSRWSSSRSRARFTARCF
jgi:hypothetical protein